MPELMYACAGDHQESPRPRATWLFPFSGSGGYVLPLCAACTGEKTQGGVQVSPGETSQTPAIKAALQQIRQVL